jgi:peroxisomal 2,4-dienoyl-CoA reductase
VSAVFQPDFLAGRVALVTGGGSGIGKGIALALARHGADVAAVGRKPDRLEQTAQEISGIGRRALALPADVREWNAIDGAIARAAAELGPLDVLVNAAAGNFLAPAAALSSNGFRTVMDIDALGTFNASRAAFDRSMRDRGGTIVNVSATLHYGATHFQIHAAAAKAAVDAVTRGLALEWGPANVRVVGVAPGPIEDTEGLTRLVPANVRERMAAAIPLRRFGRIDEVADVVLFLVSPAAALVSGTVVVADGGAWLAAGSGTLVGTD